MMGRTQRGASRGRQMKYRVMMATCAALLLMASVSGFAATYEAASCNEADVNAVINGPIHVAVDGDVIRIPGGACTWTAGIVVPSGIGIQIIGAGENALTITDGIVSPITPLNPMIIMQPTYGNSPTRLSSMTFTTHSTSESDMSVPIIVDGTCAASGCPSFRADHLRLENDLGNDPDSTFIIANNVFGVADHNTVGDDSTPVDNGIVLVSVSDSGWQGVGQYGDNSWAQPDTFGTGQEFYVESNVLDQAMGTDTDSGYEYNLVGGGRFACRFDTFLNTSTGGTCDDHGTETTGRPRGGRQVEFYANTSICTNPNQGCAAGQGLRSGVDRTFGNLFFAAGSTADHGWYNVYMGATTERTYRPTSWIGCDGVGPYDVNHGYTPVGTYTLGAYAAGPPATITVSGTPWTASAFNFSDTETVTPSTLYYVVYDETTGDEAGITSNTDNTLTLSWLYDVTTSITLGGKTFSAGDTILVFGVTLYQTGTMTGTTASETLTDSNKSWTANEWVDSGDPYSVIDVSTGQWYQIGTQTSNTLSYNSPPFGFPTALSGGAWDWNPGDVYVILRADQCLDQPGVEGGSLLSGNPASIPTAAETVDPSYEFDDGGYPVPNYAASDSLGVIANRNYYAMNASFAPSTSSASDMTTGTGYGPLADMPTSCTTGVAYWATDQGNWNQSGNGWGQGELYICTATNTWTLSYTPYVYPHPLVAEDPCTVEAYDPYGSCAVGSGSAAMAGTGTSSFGH